MVFSSALARSYLLGFSLQVARSSIVVFSYTVARSFFLPPNINIASHPEIAMRAKTQGEAINFIDFALIAD